MGQEPGDNDEILNGLKYVRPGNGFVPNFPISQKISVNGLLQDSIWSAIKSVCPAAVTDIADVPPSWTPVRTTDVAWNFEAVLINKKGQAFRRYATIVDPKQTASDVEYLLSM